MEWLESRESESYSLITMCLRKLEIKLYHTLEPVRYDDAKITEHMKTLAE